MEIDTLEAKPASVDPPSEDLDALPTLQREMLTAANKATTPLDLLGTLVDLMAGYAEPEAVLYLPRDSHGNLADGVPLRPTQDDGRSERFTKLLTSTCQLACQTGKIEVREQPSRNRIILSAPIPQCGRDPESLGFLFPAGHSTAHLVLLVQMVTSHMVLYQVLAAGHDNLAHAHAAGALVELLDEVGAAPDLRQACYTLSGELLRFLQCQRVAVGLRPVGKDHCRLVAVSGVAQYDSRSSTAHAIEAAMDESVLRREVTRWPANNDQQRHAALAHKNLCSLDGTLSVVSVPLIVDEIAIGVVVVWDDKDSVLAHAAKFLQVGEKSLAVSLVAAQRIQGGGLSRMSRAIDRFWQSSKGKCALAGMMLGLAAMLIPWPHKVHCECQVEPVIRRFVAAPFESTLDRSLVKPGDLVRQGQVLAKLDGRELTWKRASVAADQSQAIKKRDAAQASHDYADQQIAQLDIQRLNVELQLLDHRGENLEIRSPLDGIVVSGDLERAEGAPLTIGQTLFEIAPLDRMVVEVAIPDDEVSRLAVGQTIDIRLDAYPGQPWQATLQKLQPRSEIRDEQNVFIAEAEVNNARGLLRPGMKGRANVSIGKHSIGWILFHKPWEYATKMLSW